MMSSHSGVFIMQAQAEHGSEIHQDAGLCDPDQCLQNPVFLLKPHSSPEFAKMLSLWLGQAGQAIERGEG